MSDTQTYLHDLEAALLAVDRTAARRLFSRGVQTAGAVPFMENQLAEVLDRVGSAWEEGRIALSQVYMAGRICEELALEALPEGDSARTHDLRVALAVFEDEHLLGKRMVLAVLRNQGFAIADWGKVDLAGVLTRLEGEPVDILLLSCLMLSSALRIRSLTTAIRERGLPVRVVVGGAPFRFDANLWREVGADAMGTTASQAGSIIRRFAENRS